MDPGVVLVLAVAACAWPPASGVAHGSATTNAAAAGSLRADFNNDGFADLAVAAPFEDIGAISDAGAVNVLYGSAGGLTGVGRQLFTQDSPGVGSNAERGDLFGSALAASGPQRATASLASPASRSGERTTCATPAPAC